MASGAKKSKTVTSYKAFDHDLYCRGFQYEVGKTYKVEGKIVACENGFHACENPLDVWGYYPIIDVNGKLTRYAEVEQSGEQDDNGDKIASAEITIKAELTLPDFIKRAVTRIIDLTKGKNDKDVIGSSGDGARIGSSGYGARIGSSGKDAVIASAGINVTASGEVGTWISLAEFDDNYKCVGFATGCIGKDGLKPNTPYRAKNGKLVEAN